MTDRPGEHAVERHHAEPAERDRDPSAFAWSHSQGPNVCVASPN